MTDCGGDVFHDQGSAVIMIAHSICAVYAVCNVQVLGKESQAKQREEQRRRRCASRLRKRYVGWLKF
jgi:hypothetical protein